MDDKIKKYYVWYEQVFAGIMKLSDLEDYANEKGLIWLKKAKKLFLYAFSSIWRYETLSYLRFYIVPKKTEFICSIFRIFRTSESSCHPAVGLKYGMIYCIMYSTYKSGEITFEYVTSGHTFKSADGEYRYRFIPIWQVFNFFEKNKDLSDALEEHVAHQLKNDITFSVSHTIPKIYPDIQKSIDAKINKSRLDMVLYKSCLVCNLHQYAHNSFDNHIIPGFKETIFSADDLQFEQKLEKDFVYTLKLVRDVSYIMKTPGQLSRAVEVGQKFIPLTVHDVENSDDVKLAPWREIFITSLVGDLVINSISPGFPIYGDWFFIQGNSYDLWDNKVSKIKIDHSKLTIDIVRRLEQARKGTYLLDPINKKKTYISFALEGLSDAIEIPMEYAEQELILADVTLCTLTEHLGRTVADIPNILLHIPELSVIVSPIVTHFVNFAKFIFEFVYELYCLNHKLGIIHGDLHLNNITNFIHTFKAVIDRSAPLVTPNPYIIYNIHNQRYIFPIHGCTSCIIDFSRSFISREQLLKSFDEYKVDDIIRHQKLRMLRTLEHEIPDFFKSHETEFNVAILEDFDTCFIVFQAIDVFKLCRGITSLLNDLLVNCEKQVDPEMIVKKAIPFLKQMSDAAYAYITKNFEQIFEKKKPNTQNINLQIITQFFEFALIEKFVPTEYNGESTVRIVDYFTIDNEMLYNCREYDKFPENVKFDYVIANKIPGEEMGIKRYEEYKEYLRVAKPDEQIEKIKQDVRNSTAERRGADPDPIGEPEESEDTVRPETKVNTSSYSSLK